MNPAASSIDSVVPGKLTRASRARTRTVGLMLALLPCAFPVGCAGTRNQPNAADSRPAVAGQGMQITMWSLSDAPSDVDTNAKGQRLPGAAPQASLADAIAALVSKQQAGPPDAPTASVQMWEGSGLRVYRVKASELGALEQAVGAQAGQRRSWVVFGAQPTEIVRSARGDERTLLATDAGPLAMNGGSFVLSVRGWPLPPLPAHIAQGPAAQVELLLSLSQPHALQRGTILAEASTSAQQPTALPGQAIMPGLLPRLTFASLVASGDCLLIEPVGSALAATPAGSGPPVPSLPSLGEAMLTDVLSFPRAGVRVVVIVRPVLETPK